MNGAKRITATKNRRMPQTKRQSVPSHPTDLQTVFAEFAGFDQEMWVVWIEDFMAGKPRHPNLNHANDPLQVILNDVYDQLSLDARLRFRRAVTVCLRSLQFSDHRPPIHQMYVFLQVIAHMGTSDGLDVLRSILTSRVLANLSYNGINLETLIITTLGDPAPDESLIRFINQSIGTKSDDAQYIASCLLVLAKPGRGLSLVPLPYFLAFILEDNNRDLFVDVIDELLVREGYELFYSWYNIDVPKLAQENLQTEIEALESVLRDQLIPRPQDANDIPIYGKLLAYSLNVGHHYFTAKEIWDIVNFPRKCISPTKMKQFTRELLQRIWRKSREQNPTLTPWFYRFDQYSHSVTIIACSGNTTWLPGEYVFSAEAYAEEFAMLTHLKAEEEKREIVNETLIEIASARPGGI